MNGLIKANELALKLNGIIDLLNKSLKTVPNKISAKILQESGLWDVPHANIKHGFLGSLVLYSLDPTITSAKLKE